MFMILFGFYWALNKGFNLPFFAILALFFLILFLDWIIDKMKLNSNYKPLVAIAILLDLLSYFYISEIWGYFWYILHFVNAALITFMIYDYYKKNFTGKKIYLFLFVFLSVMGVLVLWEVYEYTADTLLHVKLQGLYSATGKLYRYPIDDTMWDLIIGGIGSLLSLLIKKIISNKK